MARHTSKQYLTLPIRNHKKNQRCLDWGLQKVKWNSFALPSLMKWSHSEKTNSTRAESRALINEWKEMKAPA